MKTEKIVELSFLCAIGIVLQILESFLPTSWIIPGFKIGFANITALFVLKMYGIQSMWLVSAMRVFWQVFYRELCFRFLSGCRQAALFWHYAL